VAINPVVFAVEQAISHLIALTHGMSLPSFFSVTKIIHTTKKAV